MQKANLYFPRLNINEIVVTVVKLEKIPLWLQSCGLSSLSPEQLKTSQAIMEAFEALVQETELACF